MDVNGLITLVGSLGFLYKLTDSLASGFSHVLHRSGVQLPKRDNHR